MERQRRRTDPGQAVELLILADLDQAHALVRDNLSFLSALVYGDREGEIPGPICMACLKLAINTVEAHPIEWGTGKETEPPGKDAAVDGSAVNNPGAGEQLARPSVTDGGGEKIHHQASKPPRSTRLTECLLGLLCFVIFLITLGPAEIDD